MAQSAAGNAVETSRKASGRTLAQLLDMPLAFLGFALWRAWVSLSYADPACALPLRDATGQLPYDAGLAVAALVIAVFSSRLAPLNEKEWSYGVAGVLFAFAMSTNIASVDNPGLATVLAIPSTVAASVASALLILLWCEAYSCLNPARVAVYYALSMVLGVVVTFILKGFTVPYLHGALVLLPILSLMLVHRSYHRFIPVSDRPQAADRPLVPWKLIAIMALYGVAEGLAAAYTGGADPALVGSHSTISTLVAAMALFVLVYWLSDRFPLSVLYRAPLVIIACGLLLIPLFGFAGGVFGEFCISMGTTLFSSIVFLFLCDVSKRLGVLAICLFGIEEALVMTTWAGKGLGWLAIDVASSSPYLQPAVLAVAAMLVVGLSLLVLNDRELGSRWGITFLGKQAKGTDASSREEALCARVAEERGLTPRETEVLELLVRGKSLSQVASALFIADGTAKAHTRHIYEKLGINSRQELFSQLKVKPPQR